MDLGTVRERLVPGVPGAYGSPAEFIKDLNLVFHNCSLFNDVRGSCQMCPMQGAC